MMQSWKARAILTIVFFYSAATSATEREEHAAHNEGVKHHANVIGVFAGVTHAGRRMNEAALGIEYERRLGDRLGIGGLLEYTFGEADLWVAAIPFAYHTGHWKFLVAPGVEDGHHGTEGLVRFAAEYAFPLSDGWEIAPQVNVDLVDGEDVWVFGVVLAKGF